MVEAQDYYFVVDDVKRMAELPRVSDSSHHGREFGMKNSETSSTSGILDLAAIPKNVREPHSSPGFFRSPNRPPVRYYVFCAVWLYHNSRPHQSLERNSPVPREIEAAAKGKVVAIPQVGGLHHRYRRAA